MSLVRKIWGRVALPWHRLFLPRIKGAHIYFGPDTLSYGGPDLKLAKLKKRFGNSMRPNLIYTVTGKPLPALFLALMRLRGIKVILNQDGVFYPAWYPIGWHQQNKRIQKLHELSDFVVYQSQFCVESTQQWVKPLSRPSITLYNAIDSDHFCPGARADRPFTILACSYFNRSNLYVFEHLLDVMVLMHQEDFTSHLLVAGKFEGNDSDRLPGWAIECLKKRGLRDVVEYLGTYRPDEAPSIYQRADVFLHLKYMDPCPSTVLEAMACGLPVVYSHSGGTPELVGDAGIGIQVPQDYGKLHLPTEGLIVEALVQIQKMYVDYSNRARKRVIDSFAMNHWHHVHQTLFNDLLEKK